MGMSAAVASGLSDSVSNETRAAELALIAAARDGDRAAFGALYRQYGRLVHGIVLARVSRPDVEDLVQDVFLQAMKQLSSLRDARAFGGWLAAIARNLTTDHLRRTPRVAEMPEDLAVASEEQTEARAVLDVIRTLPAAYRETLVLRLVEGMTGPEISARTGLTPASVRVNLHRGMRQLRERLEGSGRRA
ncbi:MAG: polymerase sigma-70 factor, subfamily [Acidobacteriota bacterium]|jgi:RNA polymerase sigma-70 factor (ECF subfamily)